MELVKNKIKDFNFTDEALVRGNKLREFVFAGNATFTVLNTDSGNRFTFKVKKHKTEDLYFVSVMTGSDNVSSYTFLGTYFPSGYRKGKRSRISDQAVSAKTCSWFFNSFINNQKKFPMVEVYHAGKCGRCNRKLTTPQSIRDGFGPECIKLMGKK